MKKISLLILILFICNISICQLYKNLYQLNNQNIDTSFILKFDTCLKVGKINKSYVTFLHSLENVNIKNDKNFLLNYGKINQNLIVLIISDSLYIRGSDDFNYYLLTKILYKNEIYTGYLLKESIKIIE